MNETDGFSEQSKKIFKPLQAADVLAWQWGRFMIVEKGVDTASSFYRKSQMADLFDKRRYACGHINRDQFRKWVHDLYEDEITHGTSAFFRGTDMKLVEKV
jgi:hypothetical protein